MSKSFNTCQSSAIYYFIPFNVANVNVADVLQTMKGAFLKEIPNELPNSRRKTQEPMFSCLLPLNSAITKHCTSR